MAFTEFDKEFIRTMAAGIKNEMIESGFIDDPVCPHCGQTKSNHGCAASGEDWVCPESEDALDHADSIEDHKSELIIYWKCPGCDFPHLTEQQAINCCPPVQVFCCPKCGSFRYSEYEALECCR